MRRPTVRGANINAILGAGGAVFLLASSMALADPNTGAEPVPTAEADVNPAESAPDDFGPVDTKFISLANVAPGVFSWFNDGAVFGLPGTRVGSITERTHLTNDWGGLRTEWARNGVFLNLYNTTAYQQMSGGLDPGGSVINNTQISVDLDTGRLGWWSGGLFHFAAEARAGSDNSEVYGAGTLVPTYYGAVLPQPGRDNDILFTNFFLEQAFGKAGLIVGVIPGLYFPDRTLFGDDWRRFFANYAFNQNPIWTLFSNPQTATLTATYRPIEELNFTLGVYDAKTDTTDFSNFFDEIYVYGQGAYSYEASGLPGQVLVGGLWSNQEQLNLRDPLSVSILPGAPPTTRPGGVNLTGNFTDSSWFMIANFSQYLFVKKAQEKREVVMARGDPLRGIGMFGRAGYAPPESIAITAHFSLAVLVHGLVDARPNDSFGFGGSYNMLSGDLKNGVRVFSGGDISIDDESAIEAFYNVRITPAVDLNTSYQHVWNPFTAALAGGDDSADILMVRLSTYW
jgi:carbohydrate-selective porin OprB